MTLAALVRLRGPTCGQPARPPPPTWQHGHVTAATHSTLFPQVPDSADAVLEGLDPEQREVATALHGPVCVLAGAGTGKTRAITHRIAYGVRAGILQPSSVLAVTFTNRAAGEMRGRLRQLGAQGVQARTFHSAALRQLQYFWPKAIGGSLPRLVDRKIQLVADAAAACRIRLDRGELRDTTAEIEWSKVTQTVPADYALAAARAGREIPRDPAEIAQLYAAYEDLKRQRGVIDFEDVLLLTVAVLQDRHDIAEQVRAQYQHFVVDEYQDVSPLQQRLLELWLGEREDLCVVGDASQTIYSFTGATPDHLLDFRTRHPGATVVKLVRDYRSTPRSSTSPTVCSRRPGAAPRTTAWSSSPSVARDPSPATPNTPTSPPRPRVRPAGSASSSTPVSRPRRSPSCSAPTHSRRPTSRPSPTGASPTSCAARSASSTAPRSARRASPCAARPASAATTPFSRTPSTCLPRYVPFSRGRAGPRSRRPAPEPSENAGSHWRRS